jgi:hypothetical protein
MIKDTRLTNIFCDVCSKRILAIGGGFCYNEPICDFAVCINCYGKLPREDNIAPMHERENPAINYLERE